MLPPRSYTSQTRKKIGITQETISGYERGKEAPGAITLMNLALVLHTTVDCMMGITDIEHLKPELKDLLNTQELEAVELFRQLSCMDRERVIGYMYGINEKK